MSNTEVEELILNKMPFASEIIDYCKTYPDFRKALKIIYYKRFICLQAIVTSYSPNFPNDEVIGIFVYDYSLKNQIFKQDFLVNKNKSYDNFVLYTGYGKSVNGKNVRHINEFLQTYGEGGYYEGSHHIEFNDLPDLIKPRAKKAIKIADSRLKYGNPKINIDQAEDISKKFIEYKKNR